MQQQQQDSQPTQPLWSDGERAAWAPPEQLSTAEWAEKYRVLSRRQSSRPGQWRNSNQPALVGLMNLCDRPGIAEIWEKKSAQFGGSEGLRNVIAKRAHLDPCPAMLVLPDEKAGRKIVNKRIIPLFEDTEVLRRLLTGNTRDKKLTQITLSNGFELQLAWAGSPSAMASDPFSLVILDEVDKYPPAAQQADPIAEARVRLRTFGDRGLLVAISTPSTPLGPIAVGYDACRIKLHYHAPCPHCGGYQRLAFDRLRWEKFTELPDAKGRAERIRSRGAAWYECEFCASRVPSGQPYPAESRIVERHRREMLSAGYWGTEDGEWKLFVDGREEGTKPEGSKVGVHVHGLIDLSVSYAEIAAQFVECDGQASALKDFYNLTLGLEFADAAASVTVSAFSAKCRRDDERGFVPPPAKRVPPWASKLLMTVDTQKDYFWFVIRAWGHGLRSQRVHHGRATSFEEIEELYYRATWHYEGEVYAPLRCFGSAPLAIDSGGGMDRNEAENSITDRVYQWCLKDPTWRMPLKGASKSFEGHLRWRDVQYQDPRQKRDAYTVRLWFVDPVYWRDLLAGYIGATMPIVDPATGEVGGQVDQWMLNDQDDEEYNRHLAVMQKVRVKKGRTIIERYAPKTSGARHDYHDLETYQLAWAMMGPGQCFALPTLQQLRQMNLAMPVTPASGFRRPDGQSWLSNRRR